ncbi:hypothetical protein diail_8063 [Diaporthe ilicicola]|nr:hypothetical protein diail_8063 [Diaporthe ilicicola]
MALSQGQSSLVEGVASPSPEITFPFMRLSLEIRLLVYDMDMPKQVDLVSRGSTGLPPHIKALMNVKIIREELLSHLFSRYPFVWTNARAWSEFKPEGVCFKRLVIPFITTLTIHLDRSFSLTPRQPSPRYLGNLLNWMRWRSLRSHLYPWHLKRLTVVEPRCARSQIQPGSWNWNPRWSSYAPISPFLDIEMFLMNIPVVAGLDSLKIALSTHPGDKAIKAFLERCAGGGIEGRLGYRRNEADRRVSKWFWLQDNQVARIRD